MGGVQALVRVLLDQHRADARSGLRTASFVSGYQGSPLAGFDRELAGLGELATEHAIEHRPGVNEELGATAVWGSQLAGTMPGAKYDGVVGVWYGKAPGLDRAADAIRHGNYVGADPRGGVLALCGDDPSAKSSTLPSASEPLLAALQVPVFSPGSVQEALDLGRHAIACSRASGLWSALKVVTDVADATESVEVGIDRVTPVVPELDWEGRRFVHRPSADLLAPRTLEMERALSGARLELARRYGRANGINAVIEAAAGSPAAGLGVVASGAVFGAVRRALAGLGLEGVDSEPALRLLRVGMPFPFDHDVAREFAAGLDEILVIEEKGALLESSIRDALYGERARPLVVGKRDEQGAPLVPDHGVLSEELIARVLAGRYLLRDDDRAVRSGLERLAALEQRPAIDLGASRSPFFCSGCPHSVSTAAPDDEIVGAGIGCHAMVLLSQRGRGDVRGITQMGGEGAQWVGVAPFAEVQHFTQNLGDGTFHHSGSLAIRAAVAADLDITYKLLYNGTVAMTGGQRVEGGLPIEAAVRSLLAEGVRRLAITTEDVARYEDVQLPAGVRVHDRSELPAVQRELAQVPGVTILLHDQACATELRRARRRGRAPEPAERVVINERVCEGCGDCGEKSSCLSVEPVETEFGRKTRIDATTCNKDYTCLQGDCPSFMTVVERPRKERRAAELPGVVLPEPTGLPEAARIRMIGIGGTGVVTVSQVLGMAATLDGRQVAGLDQTGLSQKAGPVVSDVRIGAESLGGSGAIAAGEADAILAFDLLGATAKVLRVADAGRTVAIANTSIVPTGAMVSEVDSARPDLLAACEAVDAATSASDNLYFDARRLAERIFGDATPANVIVLGAAWQRGLLPVSRAAIERAFELNATGVDRNLAAFAWGRAAIADPGLVHERIEDSGSGGPAGISRRDSVLIDRVPGAESGTELRRLLEIRIPDLRGWGGGRAAAEYAERVAAVARIENERIAGSADVTEAFARGLHKLSAYKDEYEVARLHLQWLASLPPGARAHIHLQPPLLRALGLRRKLRFGRWFKPFLHLLRVGRILRGTPLDPFGYARLRKVERELPREYVEIVARAVGRLEPETLPDVLEVASLPDLVRGYEEIKLASVERFRGRGLDLSAALDGRSPTGP